MSNGIWTPQQQAAATTINVDVSDQPHGAVLTIDTGLMAVRTAGLPLETIEAIFKVGLAGVERVRADRMKIQGAIQTA